MNRHEKRLRKYEQQRPESEQATWDHVAVQKALDELSDDELNLLEAQFNGFYDGEHDDGDYDMIEKFYDIYRQKMIADGD